MRPQHAFAGSRIAMRFGVLAGFTSWILLFGVICAATGRTQLLLPMIVPMLLASLGLGLLLLVLLERMLPPGVRQLPPGFGAVLQGALGVALGILLLLAQAYVMPALQTDRGLGGLVRDSGGVLEVPLWVPVVLLSGGCVALALGLRAGGKVAVEASPWIGSR